MTYRGDPSDLTWALFDYPDAVHAMPGKYVVGVTPGWPSDHVPSAVCPCQPEMIMDSDAAPRPLFEHRRTAWLPGEWPAKRDS